MLYVSTKFFDWVTVFFSICFHYFNIVKKMLSCKRLCLIPQTKGFLKHKSQVWYSRVGDLTFLRHHMLLYLRGCLHDIQDRISIRMNSLRFLHSPSCNSAFERTVFTWLRNESKVIPDWVRTGFYLESKLSFQYEILSWNHINGDQAHSGMRPTHVLISTCIVLFFFGFLLLFCRLST